MLGETRVVSCFLVLCLALIGCDARGVDLGLCADDSVACPCGSPEIGLQVQIPIKECTYFYRWKPYCKACDEFDEAALCSQFRNCLSCNARRDGKCATCAPGRYGDSCQGICQCQNNGRCNRETGACECSSGFSGARCEHRDAATCSSAPTIANGNASGRNGGTSQEGSVVTYNCNPGYLLVGPARKRCESSGVWSGGEPRCEYSCPIPTATDNLQVDVEDYQTMSTSDNANGVTLVRRVHFTCSNGYTLQGSAELNCLPSSQWNGQVPTCVRTCGQPPNLQNGRYEGTNWLNGGVVRYYCNDRWQLSGDSSLTCTGGQWRGTAPSCATVNCPKPVVANGNVAPNQNTFQVRATASVSCASGFELVGRATLTCLNTGSWNQALPSCTRVTTTAAPITCPTLQAPDNGQLIRTRGQGDFLPGQSLEFLCNEGFLLSGLSRLICEAGGNWSGRAARCIQVITCPDPGTPQNAIRQVQQPRVGGRNGGRSRFGPRLRGSLRPNSRVAGRNGEAAAVVDIQIPDGRFRVLTRVTYDCESRFYQLVGPQHRECQHSGQWSGRQPTCIPVCGKSEGSRAPTIINGEVSRLGEWPWQASLAHKQTDGSFYGVCGGTVISETWIVTAAHCVTNRTTSNIMPITNLQVRLGMYHRSDVGQDNGVQVFRVSEIHVHPNYDPDVLDSDIAVVRLATSATLTDRVAPVCMPGSGNDGVQLANRLIAPGSTIVVTGWGETENRTDASTLMKASLGTISSQSCEDKYTQTGLPLIVTSNMFCAGHDDGRSDTCFGDSGGPAVGFAGSGEDRRWYLVGVVSWGSPIDCGIPMQYSGFTKMSRFLSFVNQFTGL